MKNRHTIVPAVYTLLRKDTGVLFIRRANTGYMDGAYGLPSGHIEAFESAEIACVRESKEEIGIDIALSDLKLVHVMYRKAEEGDHERVCFFFEIEKWDGEIINNEPEKCDDVKWFEDNKLPENMPPEVEFMFEQLNLGKIYSSFNY